MAAIVYINKLIAIAIVCVVIHIVYSLFSYLCGVLSVIVMLVCVHSIIYDDASSIWKLVYKATCKVTHRITYVLSWL